jgi:hypothetical protein
MDGLSAQWLADRALPVTAHVAELILRIDAQFTEATPRCWRGCGWRCWRTAHAALLARVRLALLARGQAVVIEYAPLSA